jgi:Xaa-Pro aminopeptidase
MVITMEPGLYFIDALIHSKDQREKLKDLVQWDKAEAHLNFGGIRIEDDLLITKDGSRSLSDVPKSISDINTIRSSAPS